MTQPTPEQMNKLPKWAQEHIRDLTRERSAAVIALNESTDHQTPSPIFWDDMVSTGEGVGPTTKRFYVQSHHLTIEHAGIRADIMLAGEKDGQRLHGIDISFSGLDWRMFSGVAIIPRSYGNIQLVSKENMR